MQPALEQATPASCFAPCYPGFVTAVVPRPHPTPSWRAGWTLVALLCLLSSDAGRALERGIANLLSGWTHVLDLRDGPDNKAPVFNAVLPLRHSEPQAAQDGNSGSLELVVRKPSLEPTGQHRPTDIAEALEPIAGPTRARAPPR